jgi:hypothetical protein
METNSCILTRFEIPNAVIIHIDIFQVVVSLTGAFRGKFLPPHLKYLRNYGKNFIQMTSGYISLHNVYFIFNYYLSIFQIRWAGYLSRYTECYGQERSRFESRCGRDFPHLSRPVLWPNQSPVQWVTGLSRG